MEIYNVLLCIYLLLKPYYIFTSGGLQIGDVIISIAFLIFAIKKGKTNELKKLFYENKRLVLFIGLTFVINGIYYLNYYRYKFIISSLYYVFNLFVVFLFSNFIKNEKCLNSMKRIVKINIIVQLIIFLVGIGRYYDSTRYMGTFNDPNQFAYYIFTSYLLLHMIGIKQKSSNGNFIYLLLSFALIILSSSTGMTMGIGIFFILEMFNIIIKIPRLFKKYFVKIFTITLATITGVCIIAKYTDSFSFYDFESKLMNTPIMIRMVDKFSRIDSGSDESGLTIWEERGYDKIYNQPHVIFYGSGEGEYGRYIAAHDGEIHATFPSILFYYGIIPTIILLSWIWQYIKNQKINVQIVYLSMFLESFFLLNQRQAYFWILIVFGKIIRDGISEAEVKK